MCAVLFLFFSECLARVPCFLGARSWGAALFVAHFRFHPSKCISLLPIGKFAKDNASKLSFRFFCVGGVLFGDIQARSVLQVSNLRPALPIANAAKVPL